MYDLKSCPFCGRKMKHVTIPDPDFQIQIIGHDDYSQEICPMMRGFMWFGTAEEAAAIWNRRDGEDI